MAKGLQDLPKELNNRILSYLPYYDFRQATKSCKSLYKAARFNTSNCPKPRFELDIKCSKQPGNPDRIELVAQLLKDDEKLEGIYFIYFDVYLGRDGVPTEAKIAQHREREQLFLKKFFPDLPFGQVFSFETLRDRLIGFVEAIELEHVYLNPDYLTEYANAMQLIFAGHRRAKFFSIEDNYEPSMPGSILLDCGHKLIDFFSHLGSASLLQQLEALPHVVRRVTFVNYPEIDDRAFSSIRNIQLFRAYQHSVTSAGNLNPTMTT